MFVSHLIIDLLKPDKLQILHKSLTQTLISNSIDCLIQSKIKSLSFFPKNIIEIKKSFVEFQNQNNKEQK